MFEYCVYSLVQRSFSRWPTSGWLQGNSDSLCRCIELAAGSEHQFADGLDELKKLITRAGTLLDIRGSKRMHGCFGDMLGHEVGPQTSRMALVLLVIAFTMHSTISGASQIPTLGEIFDEDSLLTPRKIVQCWRYLLDEINCWPIFEIALNLVNCLDEHLAPLLFDWITESVAKLSGLSATTLHDLCGRVLQQLITERKSLAAFYTLPTSAALLGELAAGRLNYGRSSPTELKIADFACGTGTLLTATYQSLLRRYRYQGHDDKAIHSTMLENCLIAADIVPAATYLTASQLSAIHPAESFQRTQVYTMPYGEQSEGSALPLSLGSLDLTTSESSTALWGTGSAQVRGDHDDSLAELHLPDQSLDLVIMNPPFTRPTNHAVAEVPVPSFAGFSTSASEQKAMSQRLTQMRKKLTNPMGNGYAGLASNFLDLAHAKIRPGGTLAFVLPKTFLRGRSWQAARETLTKAYRDICLISIEATQQTQSAFSADTGLAEVLLIATRLGPYESSETSEALFVNLPTRPSSISEAVELAHRILHLENLQTGEVMLGDEHAFDYFRTPLENAGVAAVASLELATSMVPLTSGSLVSARTGASFELPLIALKQIGECGPVHRKIGSRGAKNPRGPFLIADPQPTPDFPVLWSHNAEIERQMSVHHDSRGVIRPGETDAALTIWKSATRLHFNLDFRLTSQSLSACMTPELTLGGRAWPSFTLFQEEWEKPVVLWANSTLGLLFHWWTGSRQQSGRANLTVSTLPDLLVLDPRELSSEQIERCGSLYDDLAERQMLRAKNAFRDETRHELDKRLLLEVLDLPEEAIDAVRHLCNQWCAEPSVSGGQSRLLSRGIKADAS